VSNLRIRIVSTTPARSRKGNRVTAVRWAGLLKGLGHRVVVEEQYRGGACDLLIALHATRSFGSVMRFRKEHPTAPIVLALTGTDLYRDIAVDASARRALEWAWRLVTLQPLGIDQLPKSLRAKARSIVQSAQPPHHRPKPRPRVFEVCVLAHLRKVKDPFRTAEAARLLPSGSRIQVLQVGGALTQPMAARARKEDRLNQRYTWMGELPRARALAVLSRCRLLSLTSWMEGGANAITEALACGVPIVSSRIPGSIGLLGADYAGYFEPGNTAELARLLWRAESDPTFMSTLRQQCARLKHLVAPSREQREWKRLLSELS
jgi:putative glycosyltransferase (TIGR04348 family)